MAPKPKPFPEGALGEWLKSIEKRTTRDLYRNHVPRLLRLADMTGDGLLENAEKDMDATWDKLASAANAIGSIHSRRVSLIGIRRFLKAKLPRKYRTLIPQVEIKKPRKTKPSVFVPWEQMLQICDASGKPYNKIFRLMLHCGWGVSEFLTFNTSATWNDVRAKLSGDVQRYRFDFTGRKANERQWYTLVPASVLKDIISSAVEVPFKAPRTQTGQGSGIPLDMEHYSSARRYLASAFKTGFRRSAVVAVGSPSVHELRDTFRTRASQCLVSPDVAEFALGHSIDALNYNKVFYNEDYVWKELRKIYGFAPVTVDEARKHAIVDFARLQGMPEETLFKLEKIMSQTVTADEFGRQVRELMALRGRAWIDEPSPRSAQERLRGRKRKRKAGAKAMTARNGGTPLDAPYETRIVNEDELVPLLNAGWDVVKELTSGRIIVRRPNDFDE